MASFEITRRNGDRYVVLVDDEDMVAVLAGGPWHVKPDDHTTYVQHSTKVDGAVTTTTLHRWLVGAGPTDLVDHRNGNGLDCRRDNLVVTDALGNAANRSVTNGGVSRYRGVTWHRGTGRWVARQTIQGRRHSLGYHADEVSAARAVGAFRVAHGLPSHQKEGC